MKADISVVILTFNEEIHIERAIKSVQSFAKHVIVVDSFSNDGTKQIAEACGATVYCNKFVNQSHQFRWALENCNIDTDWIMRLDADEVILEDLQASLSETIPTMDADVVGIVLERRHIFLGRWIRFGGRYPLRMLRIWRRGHGEIEDRWMDEHIITFGGRTILMRGGFEDRNEFSISSFTDKHNKYASREAIDVIKNESIFFSSQHKSLGSVGFQANAKRFIKEKIYNKIPFYISSFSYFVLRYIFQLGFLDGYPGLAYHFLQGFWYRFLVGVKVRELRYALKDVRSKEEAASVVFSKTGFHII